MSRLSYTAPLTGKKTSQLTAMIANPTRQDSKLFYVLDSFGLVISDTFEKPVTV